VVVVVAGIHYEEAEEECRDQPTSLRLMTTTFQFLMILLQLVVSVSVGMLRVSYNFQ